jgi:hypothetical protein
LTFEHGDRVIELDYFALTQPFVVLRPRGEPALAGAGSSLRVLQPPTSPLILDGIARLPEAWPADVSVTDWLGKLFRGADSIWLEAALMATGTKATAAASHAAVTAILSFFRDRASEYERGPEYGYVAWQGQEPIGVSFSDLHAWLPNVSFARYDTLSQASSAWAHAFHMHAEESDSRSDVLRKAEVWRRKLERRLEQLRGDFARQAEHGTWRQNADWLLSQLSQLEKGAASIEVQGESGVRVVQLDPAVRPEKQAERWYSKARRLRRGMTKTQEQIDRTRRDIDRLRTVIEEARASQETVDRDESNVWPRLAEVIEAGHASPGAPTGIGKLPGQPRVSCRRLRSPGGLAIWVGRTDAENDELTFHQAHKRDLWFHAQQCPGSHVILRSHALKSGPSKAEIMAAAASAAYYSKARNSSKVPVIYTEARYVRKPRKAPPGQVLVEREKSIMVRPEKLPEWDNDESV